MNNIERGITPLFSIPLYVSNLNISKKEKEYVLNLDYKRVELNNGYVSKNNKILNNKILNNINNQIKEHLNFYTNEVYKISKNIQFYITYSWAMKHIKNDKSHKHFHENSLISGVFYFGEPTDKTPAIKFHKIEGGFNVSCLSPKLVKDKRELKYSQKEFSIEFTPGLLLLFPSYLHHSVPLNKTDKTRCSLAFNVVPTVGLGDEASLTELKF
jgi:uncharacterized protein (TIGR02466 family)